MYDKNGRGTFGRPSAREKASFRENFIRARRYLFFAAFLAVFAAVYEAFSHQVYSAYMILAFAWPLAMGFLPWMLTGLSKRRFLSDKGAANLWGAAVVTFALGSVFAGVLQIYGTTSGLTKWYWIAGGVLLGLAVVVQDMARAAAEEKACA